MTGFQHKKWNASLIFNKKVLVCGKDRKDSLCMRPCGGHSWVVQSQGELEEKNKGKHGKFLQAMLPPVPDVVKKAQMCRLN